MSSSAASAAALATTAGGASSRASGSPSPAIPGCLFACAHRRACGGFEGASGNCGRAAQAGPARALPRAAGHTRRRCGPKTKATAHAPAGPDLVRQAARRAASTPLATLSRRPAHPLRAEEERGAPQIVTAPARWAPPASREAVAKARWEALGACLPACLNSMAVIQQWAACVGVGRAPVVGERSAWRAPGGARPAAPAALVLVASRARGGVRPALAHQAHLARRVQHAGQLHRRLQAGGPHRARVLRPPRHRKHRRVQRQEAQQQQARVLPQRQRLRGRGRESQVSTLQRLSQRVSSRLHRR